MDSREALDYLVGKLVPYNEPKMAEALQAALEALRREVSREPVEKRPTLSQMALWIDTLADDHKRGISWGTTSSNYKTVAGAAALLRNLEEILARKWAVCPDDPVPANGCDRKDPVGVRGMTAHQRPPQDRRKRT